MQITKTPEQLAARRARVKELMNSGRVESDKLRKARKDEAKRMQTLEEKADMIIAGLQPSQVKEIKKIEKTDTSDMSVRTLPANKKYDNLASAADKVLKELLG